MSEVDDKERLAAVTQAYLYRRRAQFAERELAKLREQMEARSRHTEKPPAFPLGLDHANAAHIASGMTLRDYFAAKAMQAIIYGCMANNDAIQALMGQASDHDRKHLEEASVRSYRVADFMLAERSQTTGQD